jgi:hypothetical protein
MLADFRLGSKKHRGVMNGNPGEKIHTNPTFFS